MHEIITIQQGRLANYLATHFWNAQETYQTYQDSSNNALQPEIINHDVHFRQGIGSDGSTETYLPRTLIYDLKQGFGSLRRINVLGDQEDEVADGGAWSGPQASLPPQIQPLPSPFSLSLLSSSPLPTRPTIDTTPFFSSFASTYFHPRSLFPLSLPHPSLTPSGPAPGASVPLQTFSSGTALFSWHDNASSSGDSVFDDHVRPWIEESSSLQALQLFTCLSDGWGGFSSRYLEELRDELGKTALWVFGLDGMSIDSPGVSQSRSERAKRALNTALAVNEISACASALIPLAIPQSLPPWAHIDRVSLWHKTALLEAAVESVLLPTRVSPSSSRTSAPLLREWEGILCRGGGAEGRKLASLAFGINEAANEEDKPGRNDAYDARIRQAEPDDLDAAEEEAEPEWLANFFPSVTPSTTRQQRKTSSSPRKMFAKIETRRTAAVHSALSWTRNDRPRHHSDRIVLQYETTLPLPLPITFPTMFTKSSTSSTTFHKPITATLSTSTAMVPYLRNLGSIVRNTVLPGVVSAEAEDALGGDEREALVDALIEAAEGYVDGFESDEDDM